VSLLERAAEVVKNSNDGLWRASFDEFFSLLTKYCRSKYETIHGQKQENAAADVLAYILIFSSQVLQNTLFL